MYSMKINFSKYQGTGNDFIIIDNRQNQVQLTTKQISFLCDRRFGIGADGLMFLQKSEQYDFEMKYYNADGNESSMCGNGGRCIVQFAYSIGIEKTNYTFLAIDGVHDAVKLTNNIIRLKMNDVLNIDKREDKSFVLNTGSPHYVIAVNNLDNYAVVDEGKKIRYHQEFKAKGINVNFVQRINDNTLQVRTYERGVEDETLSCGTGVTAAALAFAKNTQEHQEILVKTLGGNLTVAFNKANNSFNNIWLSGDASFVFSGEIIL
jgi:diaminopimelate epimerase